MRSGTYRGTSEDLLVEFHVEVDAAGSPTALSGDIFVADRFLASLACHSVSGEMGRACGPVSFRGNPRLFTGAVLLEADARGLGSFHVTVDLEGGHRDHVLGRLEWQGSSFRRISIEVDGIAGQPYFDTYTSRSGARVSLETAFAAAGLDAQVRVDSFTRAAGDSELKGYSYAEIHRAMQDRRDVQLEPGRLHTHVFVCTYLAGRNNRNVLGVMYDFGANDLNRRAREGVAVFGQHPLFSDPRVPDDARRREFVYTVIHEVGHALNLLHSFDKGRPSALSWMNYPQLYPFGAQASAGHDGSAEFWRAFPEGFDELELRHLRHATSREIGAGGLPFGVYEEGASSIYEGGTVEPRRTGLMSNPLRQAAGVELIATATKREFQLGEPVFVQLTVRAGPGIAARIPDALDPSEGYTRVTIEKPNGSRIRYQPPMRLCARALQLVLPPGAVKQSHAIPLFLSADGAVFTEPGLYKVWTELGGVDGAKVVFANPVSVRVSVPDQATADFAEKLWESPRLLQPLYLKHPLSDESAWGRLEEAALRSGIDRKGGNAAWSYLNYVAALGWLEAFEVPGRRMAPMDGKKAVARLKRVATDALPPGAQEKAKRLLANTGIKATAHMVVTSAQEQFRAEVPPNGLFGQAGLDQPGASTTVSPFAIVVRKLDGSPRFADIVSWNIQHLHGKARAGRIEKIARYMLAFRCDFWGLQEIGADGVRELVDAMNANGDVVYAYTIVRDESGNEASGQQSACVYRTDTARVREVSAPGFFTNKVDVKPAKGGVSKRRDVFLRRPLLCDVRVKQTRSRVFDFRCAIVHMKATDPNLSDKGASMRAAAAKELARWIAEEKANGAEQDFVVMGDMNAEEAVQGLRPFARARDLKLLSVGMKEKYGTGDDGAITRFSSRRLLDHIVVTADSIGYMPESDKKEQIIVRSDVEIEGFTRRLSDGPFAQHEFSDHLPVAVRFVLAGDKD